MWIQIHCKTCRLLILPGPLLPNGTKSIKKALGLSLKSNCVLRLCQTSKTLVKRRYGASEQLLKYVTTPIAFDSFQQKPQHLHPEL